MPNVFIAGTRNSFHRRRVTLRDLENRAAARAVAQKYGETLPAEQRKRLGQYFTGLRLGRILAYLAVESQTRTVLDPMAGHGDLLDCAGEAANESGITLNRLDGI